MTREQIAAAIAAHREDGYHIDEPEMLLERIFGKDENDSFEHEGWTVRRVRGSEFKGVRGSTRACWGYVADHPEYGREEFRPDGGSNVATHTVKVSLSQKALLHRLKHATTPEDRAAIKADMDKFLGRIPQEV